MWSEVDKEELARECCIPMPPSTKKEIEQIVVLVRLELYNHGLPCGPNAIQKRMNEHYHIHPLPSERTVARILSDNALTYGRTGCYHG